MKWLDLFILSVAGMLGRFNLAPAEVPILLTGFCCLRLLIIALGRDIPILEVTAIVYWLQLLAGPLCSYYSPPSFDRYVMAVPANEYFRFAVPAVVAYLIPLVWVRGRLPFQAEVMSFSAGRAVFKAGVIIMLIGIGFTILGRYVPPSLAFACFLGGELKFVGALYCYFCRHQQRRWMLAGVLGATIFFALAEGMFHQLVIWGAILTSLILARELKQKSLMLNGILVVGGFCALVVLQSFKVDYREQLMGNSGSSEGIWAAIRGTAGRVTLSGDAIAEVMRVRLNQGWIVTNVMVQVPREEPFANGETFRVAAIDSLLPRLLFPDKTVAGGREKFRRFTGLEISDTTSMGIGTIGEAYANFGVDGGVVSMLGFGALFGGMYYLLATRGRHHVLFQLWLPVIFSQAIKSETELAVVLNHLVKAGVFVSIAYLLLHKLLLRPGRSPVKVFANPAPTGSRR